MRARLPEAMKARRRDEVAALREGLAALENAEAVPVADGRYEPVHGVGAAEADRRELDDATVRQVLGALVDELESSAEAYRVHGQHAAAEPLVAQAQLLRAYL